MTLYCNNKKDLENRNTFHLLMRSLHYLKPYWRIQLICLLVASTLAALSLVNPWINKLLIDNVLLAGNISGLKLVCALFLGAYLFQSGFGVLQSYLYAKVGGSAILDLRKDLFNHLQTLSLPYYQKNKIGNIIALFTSDIATMQGLYTSTLVRLITDTFKFAALLIVMFLINSTLTWIALICLPFYAYFMKMIAKPIRHASAHVQEQRADTTGELQEKLSGIREIKAFVQEDAQGQSIAKTFVNLFRARVRLSVIGALGSISGLISAIGFLLIIWFGGKEVINGTMLTGVFIAFIGYMGNLFGPVNTFVSINTSIHTSMGAAKRVFQVLDQKSNIEVSIKPHLIERIEGFIEFRNVSFRYSRNAGYALKDISMKISPGESIALVGSSGSGKTTMAMLLLRFYDPDDGSIVIDGRNLKELDTKCYREKIGVVFQDPYLFDMSVSQNIAFGYPDANIKEIENAAEAAYASGFISELPDGYDTVIGERGVSLSGGQQQRLAIARAILKKPDLVILDEATSALDTESEVLVQKAMHHLLEGRTSIIIAHRISTIKNVSKIVVLEEGKLIEEGTYKDLMRVKGRFWKLQSNH